MPRDLETIVLKSLEKDPADRYATARELGNDLQAFLENRPIQASPPTWTNRLAKWLRRNPMVAALTAAVATLAAVVACVALLGYAKTSAALLIVSQQRDAAELARQEAIRNLYVAEMRMAQKDWGDGQISRLERTLARYLPVPGQPDLRGWEWYYNLALCHGDLLTSNVHGGGVVQVSWSPDGKYVAAGTFQGLTVFSPDTGEVVAKVDGDGSFRDGVHWRPDGERVAAVSGGDDGSVIKVWDFKQHRMHRNIEIDARVRDLSWSPDGKQIASPGPEKRVVLWDAESGQPVRKLAGHETDVLKVAWSPDGTRIAASGHEPGTILIWHVETGEVVTKIESGRMILCLAWSPDSAQVAGGILNGQVLRWDARSGEKELTHSVEGWVAALAWNYDGSRIAASNWGNLVTIFEAGGDQIVRILRGHTDNVRSLTWSPDGKRLATAGRVVKIWDAYHDRVVRTITDDADIGETVVFSPDDNRLAYIAVDRKIKVRDAASGEEILAMPSPVGILLSLAWSPNGKYLACGGDDGSIFVYEVNKGAKIKSWLHEGVVAPVASDPSRSVAVSWHPDSRRLATVSEKDALIRIWDAETGEEIKSIDAGPMPGGRQRSHRDIAWSPTVNA